MPDHHKAANVLNRNVEASAPNRKWMTDVTAIWTQEGWLSLAGVLDLSSRSLVGWAMAATQDEELVQQALQMPSSSARTAASLGPGVPVHQDRLPAGVS